MTDQSRIVQLLYDENDRLRAMLQQVVSFLVDVEANGDRAKELATLALSVMGKDPQLARPFDQYEADTTRKT